MKSACLAFLLGSLPVSGLPAPPMRCDEVPRTVVFPQAPSARKVDPPKEPAAPVAEPSRRERIQSLKDRVNELKAKLEVPPPPLDDETEPPLLVDPPIVVPEPPSPRIEPVQTPVSPPPANPPAPAEVEPPPPPQPVPVPEPAQDPPLQFTPETTNPPQPEPVATTESPPPQVPRPLPQVPEQATPLLPSAESHAPPSRGDSPLTLPTELLDHSIDRQRMGNNLYAIGAYELALMNYEKMQQQNLGAAEAQWVHFQVANCQRHLGHLAEAQKAYRRVAGESSEEWLGQMSRWWLKELDDREQLQRRVAELDQLIKTLEQDASRGQ